MTKVCVIGAGYFGRFHIEAWERLDGAELVGILDPSKESTLKTIDDLIAARPDIVDITSPPDTHLELIKQLVGNVPAIICQKPFCGGLEGATEAVAAARAKSTRLFVHENIRFQPWYPVLKAEIAAGAIGTPYQFTFRFRPGDGQGPHAYLSRQPYFQKMPRFLVHESAVHWIDTFRYLAGEIKTVTARLIRRNPAISGEDGGIIHFEFVNGQTAIFDGNRLSDHFASNPRLTLGEMFIEGSEGRLSLNGNGKISHRRLSQQAIKPVRFSWRDRDFGGNCVELTCAHLLKAIQRGSPSPIEASAYLTNLRIVEAIYESNQFDRSIHLN